MNMVEKILARKSGRDAVNPGDVVVAEADLMVMHDLSANFVTRVFREELGGGAIADPSRIAFVFDHNFSAPTEEAALRLYTVRQFAYEHGVRVFDGGSGSLHHVIIESGLWAPGQVIIGCDSHTPIYGALGAFATGVGNNSMAALGFQYSRAWFRVPETVRVCIRGKGGDRVTPRDVAQHVVGIMGEDSAIYQALEYAGDYIEGLAIEDRALFPLMSIDLGAKAAYVNPDDKTREYARQLSKTADFEMTVNDHDVVYARTVEIDAAAIDGPQVACPPTVGNVRPVAEVAGIPIHIAEVGGSTGGRLTDIRTLVEGMGGRPVHPRVRLQVVPANRSIYRAALAEGLIGPLIDAGAIVCPPGAGSNQAVNMGAMCEHEAMLSNQARNFPGRNGSPRARHYLASTDTVAASAIAGCIADPRD
jgi:3-isopropylmalate/(R)-2-methylmalate dehydratase large subunit